MKKIIKKSLMKESVGFRSTDSIALDLNLYFEKWLIMKVPEGIIMDFMLIRNKQSVEYLQKRFKRIAEQENCTKNTY